MIFELFFKQSRSICVFSNVSEVNDNKIEMITGSRCQLLRLLIPHLLPLIQMIPPNLLKSLSYRRYPVLQLREHGKRFSKTKFDDFGLDIHHHEK